MYLSLLAQMEDKYPPRSDRRQAQHRRTLARASSRRRVRDIIGRVRVAPHFGRGRPAATTEPC